MPNWTPEQLAAIENTHQTLLLSAAAGSGKTATLTERLIRLISRKENPLRVDRMLVATFTKAAAAQLREKIADALGKAIAADPENPFLAEQMLLLPLAKIRTIDSFCNDLVREHTDILQLPKTYRIPDKAESALLSASIMGEVVEDAYKGLLAEEGLQMVALADAFTNVSDAESLPSILLDLYTVLCGYRQGVFLLEDNARRLEASADAPFLDTPWGNALKEEVARTLTELMTGYESAANALWEEEGASDPVFRRNYEGAVRGELADLRAILLALEEGYTAARQAILPFGLHPVGKARGGEPTEGDTFIKTLRSYTADYVKTLAKEYFAWDEGDIPYAFRASAEMARSLFVLLREFDSRYTAEKQRRGLCDFSDLNRYALSLLLDEKGEKTPLAKELSTAYDAICIDEYQDVNEVQHLLFEAVATPTNRFMVGDIKQSIYAFRGAQPSIFARLRSTMPPPEAGEDAAVQYLSANFRSAAPVIDFCNEAFDFLFAILGKSIGYTPKDRLVQGRETKAPLPLPEIRLYLPTPKAEEEKEESVTFEARQVASAIASLLREGKKEDGSPILPSDIAILFRQGTHLPARYAAALAEVGVPTQYEDKESFFRKNEVLLALCLLNTVNNPRRDIYLAGLLRSPIYRFTMDELVAVRRAAHKDACLYEALVSFVENNPDFEKGKRFLEALSAFRDMAEGMPSDKLLYTLYEGTRLFSFVSAEEKKSLLLLYDYARRFEAVSFHGLYRLIDNLNDMMEQGFSLGDGRALGATEGVHIMTMHHSKGLEYPVCFVVECGAQLKNDAKAPFYFDSVLGVASPIRDQSGYARLSAPILKAVRARRSLASLEEELRVLYVALTRAKERLFVTASPAGRSADTVFKNAALIRRAPSIAALSKNNRFIDWLLGAFGVSEEGILSEKATFALVAEAAPEENAEESATAHNGENAEASASAHNGENAEASATAHNGENAVASATAENGESAEAKEAEGTAPQAPEDDAPNGTSQAEATAERKEEEVARLAALFARRFAYEYPYEAETRLPRKLSVSRLSPAVLDGEEEGALLLPEADEGESKEANFVPTLPRFMSGREENAAAKAGSATHIFMQFCRFEALLPPEVLAAVKASKKDALPHPAILALSKEVLSTLLDREIERLVTQRFMDEGDASRIFRQELVSFLRSPLYTQILQSHTLHRELRFHALLPAALFTEAHKEALAEEALLVQGVMDLLLLSEEGDITLADYKTDRIPRHLVKDEAAFEALLLERHRPQLLYYAAAVEKIFGKPPREVGIYSLALGRFVKL